MGDWRTCTLSDISEVIGGGTPKTSESSFWNGNIAWLTPKDLSGLRGRYISAGARSISEKGLEKSSARMLPKGAVLLTSRAPIGLVAISNNELSTNQGFKSLVVKEEAADAEFLYYWLKSKNEYLQRSGTGTTFAEISGAVVKQLQITLPESKSEQCALAQVLASLDDKIDLLHRQNKTLEALAETLFCGTFIDNAQDDWEDGTLEDIIQFNPKLKIKKKSSAPYLEMGNVATDNANPIDWYLRDFTSGMRFQNGDTLLARITPCLENGKTCFVQFLEDGQTGWGSSEFIVMRMREGYHPFISYLIARDEDFREFAISIMSGSSGRQRAQADDLKGYAISIPPAHELSELNSLCADIAPKIAANFSEIRTLESLRDTLLPKLMSGEVRVQYDEAT